MSALLSIGAALRDKQKFEVIESRQMDHLQMFHKVARALTQTFELEDILRIIMDQMAQFFGPQQWSMLMVDEKAQELYYAIAVGEDSESIKGLSRIPIGTGFAGMVAKSGTPLVVPDVTLDPNWLAFLRANPDLDIRSIACVPVRSGEKTLGVIQLQNSKLDLMSEYSISFLRILCDYAAIAIENAAKIRLIQELTITDDVTGLFNARHLYTLLDEQIELGAHRRYEFSLLFVDLDRFKQINDTHGHRIGSLLLSEVGGLMKRSLGPTNPCFRYGGDEFVAILTGMNKKAAVDATTRLWNELRQNIFLSGERLNIALRGSFGVATFPEDGSSMKDIIVAADTMMYKAKSTRDNICVAKLGMMRDPDAMADLSAQNAGGVRPLKPVSSANEPTTMLAADYESLRNQTRH